MNTDETLFGGAVPQCKKKRFITGSSYKFPNANEPGDEAQGIRDTIL